MYFHAEGGDSIGNASSESSWVSESLPGNLSFGKARIGNSLNRLGNGDERKGSMENFFV
jgi:hypothetical protein